LRAELAAVEAAEGIAALRTFDLDHFGAQFGQQLAGIGPADEVAEFKHPHAGEMAVH